jgi:gamma-glutamylcyclotransferase (GGCT)/AIG2-like uncharacterized protein YtfP
VSQALYFAYGSNMSSARMHSRIPAARLRGVGCVAGFRLAFEKLGADGTGKANLVAQPGCLVWGVLWSFPESEWPSLDRAERGYARRDVEAVCEGARVRAQTYVATLPADAPLKVSAEYARLVLESAREHGLPEEHLARIASLASGAD